jgi:hypothetical protein
MRTKNDGAANTTAAGGATSTGASNGTPSVAQAIAQEIRKLGLATTEKSKFNASQKALGRALVVTLETAKMINDGQADSTALDPDKLPKVIADAINKYTPGTDSDTGWAQFAENVGLKQTRVPSHPNLVVYSSFDDGLAPQNKDEGGVAFILDKRANKIIAWAEVSMNVDQNGATVKGSVDISKIYFKQPGITEL